MFDWQWSNGNHTFRRHVWISATQARSLVWTSFNWLSTDLMVIIYQISDILRLTFYFISEIKRCVPAVIVPSMDDIRNILLCIGTNVICGYRDILLLHPRRMAVAFTEQINPVVLNLFLQIPQLGEKCFVIPPPPTLVQKRTNTIWVIGKPMAEPQEAR